MNVTPSDMTSLSRSLSHWESAEYVFAAMVTIACAGEYIADFTAWLTNGVEERKKRLAKGSTLLLIVALSLELVCLVKTNSLSGMLIGSLSQKAEEADKKARSAIAGSDTAVTNAGAGKDASGNALDKANEARTGASYALSLARSGRQETRQLETETEELNRELVLAKTQLQTVEIKRAELEKSLVNLAVCNAPRVIPFWSLSNIKTSIDPLKPFAGHEAIIEFVPDAETRRAALNIAGSLDRAGWKIDKLAAKDGIDDGVEIQPFVGPLPDQSKEWNSLWQAEIRSRDAANAFVDFLHSYNWQASLGWPTDEKGAMIRDPKIIPPNSLRIRVGLYPAITYVSPPGAKDFAAATAKFEQERERNRKQMDNERLKEMRKC